MILRITVRELSSRLLQSQGSRNSETLGVITCPFLGEKSVVTGWAVPAVGQAWGVHSVERSLPGGK